MWHFKISTNRQGWSLWKVLISTHKFLSSTSPDAMTDRDQEELQWQPLTTFLSTTQPRHHQLSLPYTPANTKHTAELQILPTTKPFPLHISRTELISGLLQLEKRHLLILGRLSEIPQTKTRVWLKATQHIQLTSEGCKAWGINHYYSYSSLSTWSQFNIMAARLSGRPAFPESIKLSCFLYLLSPPAFPQKAGRIHIGSKFK